MYQKQWDFLIRSFGAGRLPHALLFFGPKNIGKKDFAVKFASHFLKENPGHPDFILIDTKKEIPISQIRDLIEKLSFKPYSAFSKFALINNVHLMDKEAQNCFLKFLEEPKDKTFLILITEYPNLLLPTILSRTQKIRFYPAKGFKTEENKEEIANLLKIEKSDLAEKFKTAKEMVEQEKDLNQLLDVWLGYFQKMLVSGLAGKENSYSLAKINKIIKEIQATKILLSTTNVNVRLALEVLLMKI